MRFSKTLIAGLTGAVMLMATGCGDGFGGSGGDAGPNSTPEGGSTAPAGETGDTATSDHDPVSISVVSAFDREDPNMDAYYLFEENLKKNAPWVTLDFRGSGEVMPAPQLGEAVSTGGIDMATTAAAFHSQLVPLVNSMFLSNQSPAEERESGAYDLYAEAHAAAGLHYLGRMADGVPYKLYFKDEVNPLELQGKQIRTSPVYVGLLEELGAGPVAMPAPELYGAMERGVVEGYGWPAIGIVENGWVGVTGYETSATMYSMDTVIVMSETKWNSLDEETQTVLTDSMIETENALKDVYAALIEAEAEERADAGIQVIEMSEADTEEFVRIAYEAGWKQSLERSPETQQLRDIYGN